MKKKNKGTALIIAIITIVIICMIMIYFLEKLLPISRNIKGIENSTIAYYNALTGVEEAQLFLKTSTIGTETGVIYNSLSQKGFGYNITASGLTMPILLEGNSYFDKNYNIISSGKPVQIIIGNGLTWSDVEFYFKVPDLNLDGINNELLNSSLNNVGVINWQLSGKSLGGSGLTIFASGETNMILGSQINNSIINLNSKYGFDLDGNTGLSLQNFYSSGTGLNSCSGNSCILKLSIIKPLISTTLQSIPFLEYKINFLSGVTPMQYSKIESSGYSYGFKRNIRKDIKQYTTSESTDFTIIN